MEQSKIDIFMVTNGEKLPTSKRDIIIEKLKALPDDKFITLSCISLKDPSTMLLISLLTGWERIFLDDVGLGILKIITCYGAGIWWLVDLFSVKERTQDYNYRVLAPFLS